MSKAIHNECVNATMFRFGFQKFSSPATAYVPLLLEMRSRGLRFHSLSAKVRRRKFTHFAVLLLAQRGRV